MQVHIQLPQDRQRQHWLPRQHMQVLIQEQQLPQRLQLLLEQQHTMLHPIQHSLQQQIKVCAHFILKWDLLYMQI